MSVQSIKLGTHNFMRNAYVAGKKMHTYRQIYLKTNINNTHLLRADIAKFVTFQSIYHFCNLDSNSRCVFVMLLCITFEAERQKDHL